MALHGFIHRLLCITTATTLCISAGRLVAASPPSLQTCFPAGGQVGQSVEVTIAGSGLEKVLALQSNITGVEYVALGASRFRLTVPADAPVGHSELWVVTDGGVSAPHSFVIGNREERVETESESTATSSAEAVPLNVVINGQIAKAHDVDSFRFHATQGQRVILECFASRIDSPLRATLEVLDESGKRLDVNRGIYGTDPLIDFRVPADAAYIVQVRDLTGTGGDQHIYRLAIDAGPRVAFTTPNVLRRGETSRVTLHGWNLNPHNEHTDDGRLDKLEVDVSAPDTRQTTPVAARLNSTQSLITGSAFSWHLPGSHAPVTLGITDVPVVQDGSGNHSPNTAQELTVPCEVSGQLTAPDECDWFQFEGRRGEAFHIEALGHRIQSPVDLQLSIHEPSKSTEQRQPKVFTDQTRNVGGTFRTDHPDPAGRWVCPSDGSYLIALHSVTGGFAADPRRIYRLSIRREEPSAQVVAVPHGNVSGGINVRRNGRMALDLIAIRQRGEQTSIRVTARDLPGGIEFPEVWLGPGVSKTVGVLSVDRNATFAVSELNLESVLQDFDEQRRAVVGGTVPPSPLPYSYGRLTSEIRMAVAGDAPVRLTADAHGTVTHHLYGTLQARHSPGGVVDVALQIDRQDPAHKAPVKVIGIGLPDSIENQTTVIPPEQSTGYLSFYLPSTIPPGRYSFAIQAETTVLNADKKPESVTVCSNPVTIVIEPGALLVNVDPFAAVRAKRGEVFQIAYHVRRLNGFIGKVHTELAAPGVVTDVPGLRGRGVTFVGQSDSGSIQIEVNGDAQLGQQHFLRLFAVGVVEDEPVFHGSRFVSLEITD